MDTSEKINMPGHVRQQLDQFCGTLRDILGDTLVSAILYGTMAKGQASNAGDSLVNVMLVLSEVTTDLLDRIASLVQTGAREFRLSVMVLSKDDVQRSTDVFPVKFLDMQHSHVVLCGEDVLDGLLIGGENLRLRCEQETRNTLLRLRNLYLHRTHDPSRIRATLSSAISSLLTTLNAFLYLKDGVSRNSDDDIAAAATRELRLEPDILRRLLAVREQRSKQNAKELKDLFDLLLRVAQRAADTIDRYEPTGDNLPSSESEPQQ